MNTAPALATEPPPAQPLREFWGYFSASRGALAGLAIVVLVLLVALFAPLLAPHAPNLTNNAAFLKPPFWQAGGSLTYPLGTDAIGRDILSRLMHGARLSLVIGLAVVALSVIVGTVLGLAAGYFRGIFEIAVMRLMDIILTLPSLLLAIVIVAILGPGLMNAMLAVAIVVLPHYVRITRAAVIAEASRDYVTAARMSGASHLRLMFSEILPNCTAPLIVQAFGHQPAFEPKNLQRLLTRVKPGFIRVDADEVTYPAHVILRYEIERPLIEGEIEPEDIPALWDAKMMELLGVDTRGNFRNEIGRAHV